MQKKSNILIYHDDGADEVCVNETYKSFSQIINSSQIQCVDANYLNQSDWEKNVALIVMPGGRSLPYYRKLSKGGNQKIIYFVKNGGNYLGLCAGGYYGSCITEFEKNYTLEVIRKGVLNFFDGVAEGPVFGLGKFDYQNYAGACVAEIMDNKNQKHFVYYNGGAKFNINDYQKTKILASYNNIANVPPAIILCKYGKGKALLSGVHFEYSYEGIDITKNGGIELQTQLKVIESERRKFFTKLMTHLLEIHS